MEFNSALKGVKNGCILCIFYVFIYLFIYLLGTTFQSTHDCHHINPFFIK